MIHSKPTYRIMSDGVCLDTRVHIDSKITKLAIMQFWGTGEGDWGYIPTSLHFWQVPCRTVLDRLVSCEFIRFTETVWKPVVHTYDTPKTRTKRIGNTKHIMSSDCTEKNVDLLHGSKNEKKIIWGFFALKKTSLVGTVSSRHCVNCWFHVG